MGGFAVAELNFQSMDTVLGCPHLFKLGAVVSSVRHFVELGDMVAEDPDLFFQDLLSLFGSVTSLLGSTKFLRLVRNNQIEISHALAYDISFCF
ncbi:MAG: hypothetical protein MRJ68_10965 [Nitrospira sp.]|nr:hypothetical protein [Nitrospira sp.]